MECATGPHATGTHAMRECASLAAGFAACEAEACPFPFVVRAPPEFCCASVADIRQALALEREVKGSLPHACGYAYETGEEALRVFDTGRSDGTTMNVIDAECLRNDALLPAVATLLRASVPGVDSPDWRHCDNLSPTDYNACQASQFMVLVIAIFGWWLLLHHLLRLTLYWAWPRLRRALCDRRVGGLPPLPAREEVVYATIHGGNLGIFHLVTLLMGSGLLAVAASIDLAVGWSYAVNTYAVGGTFAIAHLLYYLVGFERTGPLVVMLGSSVATDYTRWM